MYGLHLKPVTNEGLRFVLKLVDHLLAKLTARPTNIFPAPALRSQFQAHYPQESFHCPQESFHYQQGNFSAHIRKFLLQSL